MVLNSRVYLEEVKGCSMTSDLWSGGRLQTLDVKMANTMMIDRVGSILESYICISGGEDK